MFRKLVSNLSFSPALIHEVGFYAKRLKKEEATRKLTLIFMVLALIVQSLAVFSPPESANASSEQDILRGGFNSKEDFTTRYKANESNVKDILDAAGITTQEIENLDYGTVNSKNNTFVMSRLQRFGSSGSELAFTYTKSDTGQLGTTYMSPLSAWDTDDISGEIGTTYEALIGKSDTLGWFAILKHCGNLVTKTLPTSAEKPQLDIKQELSAVNISQNNVPADSVIAQPGDRIAYTITAQNDTSKRQLAPLVITLDDVLEYGALIDNGNALYDEKTQLLSWQPITIDPTKAERRSFVVQVADPVPAMAKGQSNGMSYDCVLTTAYGTSMHIKVQCPPEKDIETTLGLFPNIGATGNILFGATIGGLVVFFYVRTRQLKEEIRLIRHNMNQGAL